MVNSSEKKFTGFRYLVNMTDTRQFALRFEEGLPKAPLDVFAVMPQENGFRANETTFAIDDEVKIVAGADGVMRATTTAYQILTNDAGNLRRLTDAVIDYEITVDTSGPVPQAVYTMSGDARATLAEEGFSPGFPRSFTYALDEGSVKRLPGGGVTVEQSALESLPVPPHQKGGAFLARMGAHQSVSAAIAREITPQPKPAPEKELVKPLANPKPAVTGQASPAFSTPDAQTLVEKKDLGDGETLKLIFNFESRRVTESVFSPQGVALASHAFKDYDETALAAAFAQLQKLGGAPRPLETAKKPATLKAPKSGN